MNITAIVPVFNGEMYLAEALRSIFDQSLLPDRVIVVDDGSDDRSSEIAESFAGVELIRQRRQGAGAARNRAAREVADGALAFLDADDRWLPGKLALQSEILELRPALDIVFGMVEEFSARTGGSVVKIGHIPSAMMVRRSSYFAFGEDPAEPEFASWFLQATERGLAMHTAAHTVARRRVHDANKGRGGDAGRGYLHALKRSLDRRRAAAGGKL